MSVYGFLISSPHQSVLFSLLHNMPEYSSVEDQSTDQPGLEYIINHVFCPLKLPQGNDHSLENDLALSQAVVDAALAFNDLLLSHRQLLWMRSLKMLRKLKDSVRFSTLSAKEVESQISAMYNRGPLFSLWLRVFRAEFNLQTSLYI
jgi:hypothetical protein